MHFKLRVRELGWMGERARQDRVGTVGAECSNLRCLSVRVGEVAAAALYANGARAGGLLRCRPCMDGRVTAD